VPLPQMQQELNPTLSRKLLDLENLDSDVLGASPSGSFHNRGSVPGPKRSPSNRAIATQLYSCQLSREHEDEMCITANRPRQGQFEARPVRSRIFHCTTLETQYYKNNAGFKAGSDRYQLSRYHGPIGRREEEPDPEAPLPPRRAVNVPERVTLDEMQKLHRSPKNSPAYD